MHLRMQWRRLYARLVSIPAVTLFAVASAVAVLSKLSIAAASEQPELSLPQPRLERASFAVVFEGIASYYAHAFHGRRTAHGKRFNMYEFTAAHRTLPFGTILRVTNPATGECLLVQINDRGPFVKRRVLDLSYAAASALGVRLGKIRAEGFAPSDIASDSLALLFLGPRYEPYRADRNAFSVIEEFTHFSHALRAHRLRATDPDIALAILPMPGEEGTGEFRYAVVRLSPLVRSEDSLAAMLPPP
ncbi:MAG: hypothetical protein KatS3mg040_1496 [Candidatus Kapaibacterium sp.]|nr:MAG: hypothetical protein KatS3mg040_1496 [Candidatus Kapabacteria bacterium]